MTHRQISLQRCVLALIFTASPALANTVLDFDACAANPPSSPCYATANTSPFGFFAAINNGTSTYGNNVAQNLDPNGQGYYGGTANTPHVTVQFDSVSLSGWAYWGGAEDGLSFAADTGAGYVTLTAASGYQVTLNSFDYNVFGSDDFTLEVLNGGPSSSSIASNDSGYSIGTTSYTFYPNFTANQVTIFFDNWNTGLNNIDFSESSTGLTATPEPASMGFAAAGILCLVLLRRRRTRCFER